MTDHPVAVVIGAGPGVSRSVSLILARAGYAIGLLGTEQQILDSSADELSEIGVPVLTRLVDITDVDVAAAVISEIGTKWGGIDILHFNPSAFRERDPLELRVSELLEDVALGVGGLLTAARAARPFMSSGGRITVTGSMAADRPWSRAASLGVQKAGVRNLVRSLDTTLAPDGIRAVSVTVWGTLGPGGPFTPDLVAQAIVEAAHRDSDDWTPEVAYDPEGKS